MSYRIYLVEDELNLNQVLASYLQKEGWLVTTFYRGEEALKAILESPDLWILDIMLPDIDGYQLIREIKAKTPNVPVIFISARDADLDRVLGLEMGSEDYLPKPFLPRELVIRTKRLLERTYSNHAIASSNLSTPPYLIDESKRWVKFQDQVIDLTSKEFDFILLLAKNTNQAFAREQILQSVWGKDYFGSDRVVDDLVRRIRKKMPDCRIETIYGYGYRMVMG